MLSAPLVVPGHHLHLTVIVLLGFQDFQNIHQTVKVHVDARALLGGGVYLFKLIFLIYFFNSFLFIFIYLFFYLFF